MTTANELRAIALEDAVNIGDQMLIDVMSDTQAAWDAIRTIAADENYLPVVLKENNSGNPRTDVSTMKANLARRKQLVGWIANEQDLNSGAQTVFKAIYESELALLDVYAISVVLALYKEDGTILNYIFSTRAKREETRKAKRSEGAKKAAEKRKVTMAERKREFEEAQKAKNVLEALIAQGVIDPEAFNLQEPCGGEARPDAA